MKNKVTILLSISSITALLCIGAYTYLYSELKSYESESYVLNEEFLKNKNTLNNLIKIEDNLKTTLSYNDVLQNYFLRKETVVDFIQLAEGIMKDVGVRGGVDSVSFEDSSDLKMIGKDRVLASITVSGEWNNVLKFIGLLEKLPYKSRIDFVNLGYAEIKPDNNKAPVKVGKEWSANIKMYVWAIVPALEPEEPAKAINLESNESQ